MHGADDIVQDVYLNLCSRANIEHWREPRAFLFRTIGNLIIDRWRVQQRQLTYLDNECNTEDIVCPQPNSEGRLYSKQQIARLVDALDQLPEMTRHAFILNRIDGLTHIDIATRLGVSSKTVQRHIEHAMEHCLARMAD